MEVGTSCIKYKINNKLDQFVVLISNINFYLMKFRKLFIFKILGWNRNIEENKDSDSDSDDIKENHQEE